MADEPQKHEYTRWMLKLMLNKDSIVHLLALIIVLVTVGMLLSGTKPVPEFWQTCFAVVMGYYFKGSSGKGESTDAK